MPRRNLSRPWTDEEDAKLRQLLDEGRRIILIAGRMGRSPKAINSRRTLLATRTKSAAANDLTGGDRYSGSPTDRLQE